MSTALSTKNISISFGGVNAVHQCSVEIKKKSITGLIGPNGAGKTTLFNLIAGVYKPDQGRVFMNQEDITNLQSYQRFRKGLVRSFQIPHEFNSLSVLDNLMVVATGQLGENLVKALFLPGRVRQQEQAHLQRARKITQLLRLDHLEHEVAGNLSGGQKKLLELGRTLMTDAQVVLLDEPAAGINQTLLVVLTEAIQRLNHEYGYTFCIVEHDMDLVRKLCDPVIVMHNGQILTQGLMDDVSANEAVLEAYLGGDSYDSA